MVHLCHVTQTRVDDYLALQGQTGPRIHNLSLEPVAHLSQYKLLPLLLPRCATVPYQLAKLALQGQTGPRMHDLSPEPVAHLSQHKLLPLLLHRAQAAAGQDSIRFGHQLQHFQQTPTGVKCHIQPSKVKTMLTRGLPAVYCYVLLELRCCLFNLASCYVASS